MKGIRLNSKGSSLILVVVGAAFLGILGAMILSITYTNIDLKTSDNATKKNFYVDEVAVNEITALLEQYSSESLASAYTWMVKNYVKDNFTEGMTDIRFKKRYMMELSSRLYNGSGEISGLTDVIEEYRPNILKAGIKSNSTEVVIDTASGGKISYSQDDEGNKDYDSMTLEKVSITYTDNGGYQTKIVTDITIEIPVSDGIDTTFAKYALISDKLVKTNSMNVNVTGGVYGGTTDDIPLNQGGDIVNPNKGGIWVDGNGNLTINGKGNIVATRANITVSSKAKLTITNANVWAKNIMTFNKIKNVVGGLYLPELTIDGVTKVQDDLILKANDSNVRIKGAYYGFSCRDRYENEEGKQVNSSSTSSAITINSKNVSLDFSGLETLEVMGRAFISNNVSSDNKIDVSDKLFDIMTGQTVALKYDQAQYLAPNNKSLKLPMNPIPITELNKYADDLHTKDPAKYDARGYNPSTSYLALDVKTDIMDFTKGYGKEVEKFLDADEPFRAIYYKHGTGAALTEMANFYLNFKDSKSANEYFKWYCDSSAVNKNQLKDTYGQFYDVSGSDTGFKFKPGNIKYFQFAGDVFYRNDSGDYKIMEGDSSEAGIKSMTQLSKEFTDDYKSVQLNLREDGAISKEVDGNKNPYVESHFNLSNIKSVSSAPGYNATRECLVIPTGITTSSIDEACVYISGADTFKVSADMKVGIVIASGDVDVETLGFEGVIIAAGKIEIDSGATLTANEKLVNDILDHCYRNGNVLRDYINGYDNLSKPALGDDSINYAKSIYFENWSKNA